MAGRRGTALTTPLALHLFLLLVVLVKSEEVTQQGIASPAETTAAAAAAMTPATEDQESTYVNASSSSSSSSSAAAAASGLPAPGKSDVGCRGLRSKRYISDGFCRTLKPISEVLCTGYCVPERYAPWYPEFMQIWGRAKVMEYRCVDGVVRNQKIRLMCDNGKMRVYKVRVVKSCSCRKHVRPPMTSSALQPISRQQHHRALPSSTSPAYAAAETGPSRKRNRQRHQGNNRKRLEAQTNA